MACQTVPCPHLGSELANPGLPRSRTCELNCCASGPAPKIIFLKKTKLWESSGLSSQFPICSSSTRLQVYTQKRLRSLFHSLEMVNVSKRDTGFFLMKMELITYTDFGVRDISGINEQIWYRDPWTLTRATCVYGPRSGRRLWASWTQGCTAVLTGTLGVGCPQGAADDAGAESWQLLVDSPRWCWQPASPLLTGTSFLHNVTVINTHSSCHSQRHCHRPGSRAVLTVPFWTRQHMQ